MRRRLCIDAGGAGFNISRRDRCRDAHNLPLPGDTIKRRPRISASAEPTAEDRPQGTSLGVVRPRRQLRPRPAEKRVKSTAQGGKTQPSASPG